MQIFLFVSTVLLGVACEIWAGEICCKDLGCYQDDLLFLFYPLPQCPEDMGIRTKVYTRQNPSVGETITRNTIPGCLDGNVMTVFIVHGWLENENYPWMHAMKDAFLAQGDYNVIITGWKDGAKSIWYPQPASNAKTVGGEVALIANNLIKNGKSSRALMYCVGHSLGSHICGYAGQRSQFGRISGLDPAGPLYEIRVPYEGLTPSSADFVDVIHTNGVVGIGMIKPVGHVDFYPNGGFYQPGCLKDSLNELVTWTNYLEWTQDQQDASFHLVIACSHLRAYDLFTESIQTKGFVARYHCSTPILSLVPYPLSPALYTLCPQDAIQTMGFYSNQYAGRGLFYLSTNAVPPYHRG